MEKLKKYYFQLKKLENKLKIWNDWYAGHGWYLSMADIEFIFERRVN
mgnify:CR=1 FL=1